MNKEKMFWHIIIVVLMFIWGNTFVSTKFLLGKMTAADILVTRFLVSYIILILIKPKFYKFQSIKDEFKFLVAGLSGVSLYFLLENTAVKYTLASNVALIVSAAPIITAFMAHFILKGDEKFKFNYFLGFIMSMLGIFVVVFNGKYVLKLNPIGDILALVAAFSWSIYSIVLHKLHSKFDNFHLTRKIFFYGVISSFPMKYVVDGNMNYHFDFSTLGIFNLLFLAIIASTIGYLIWNKGITILGVVKASNYIYTIPIFTIFGALVFLKETINYLTITGTVLVLGGVYISQRKEKLKVIAND